MRKVVFFLGSTLAFGVLVFACDDSSSSSSGGATVDGGGTFDAGAGEGSTPPPGEDASGVDASDASPSATDASDASDGGTLNPLFAHIEGKLVCVHPSTGALTDVGATNQEWIVLAWDDVTKVAR